MKNKTKEQLEKQIKDKELRRKEVKNEMDL